MIRMKQEHFYIDNLLFNNGSECAKNYKTIIDHMKEIMLWDEMTPFALCMGYVGIELIHEYKALDKFRYYDFVHGNKKSHGICPKLFKLINGDLI